MRVTFLGKDPGSEKDECPSLYDTDRGTYLVQGWKVSDPAVLAQLDLAFGETCVEVPRPLMSRLANSVQLDAPDDGQAAPVILRTDRDTYIVKGQAVSDAEALAHMDIPDHETVVEVPRALRTVMKEEYAVAGR
ncbi:hypothetical protein [Planomonospora venezuelensis]|uniref:Uncharacterized protein n=1 Tax=Planomonospora venezuelensis TaxID=1999 RepID=A0A841CST5_PLAVE|nr:hypothetical protein [Planomonospora venezuelensis]GIN01095.1 hypothetical protein Pve01_27530 [Planomonospora venezuelensis]